MVVSFKQDRLQYCANSADLTSNKHCLPCSNWKKKKELYKRPQTLAEINKRTQSSSSSSWWSWQGSWWTPYSYESHHGDEPSTDWTGQPVIQVIGTNLQGLIFLNSFTLLQLDLRCKTCEKMATSKSWMNCYGMTTVRIGYEIKHQKSWIMYKWATQDDTDANDNMYACVTLHYTDANDDMHDCVTPHDAHSTEHIHWAPCTVLIVILISSTHLAQVWVSPFTLIHMVIYERAFSLLWLPLSTCLSSRRPCTSSFSSSSPTRSSWQTCTAPLRRVWTPTTSSPSPQEWATFFEGRTVEPGRATTVLNILNASLCCLSSVLTP